MKLLPLIFLLLAIQMSMFIFVLGNTSHDGSTGPYNMSSNSFFCHYTTNYTSYNDANLTTVGGDEYGGPDLWTLIFCPAEGNSTRMIYYLVAFAWLIGAVGFFPFVGRSDLSLLAGPFLFMLGAGAPTIIQLYSFINSEVSAIACSADASCFIGQFFAILIAGPLLISWVMACVDWWTGRPSS